MKRDVPTRWNSTAELVERASTLRPALDRLVLMVEFNKPCGVNLSQYRLSSQEWDLLIALKPMLNVRPCSYCFSMPSPHINFIQGILYATNEVSKSAIPLVHDVIPLIDSITSILDETMDNVLEDLAIRHAALRGLLLLNKYYARTDDTVVYRIAMSKYLSIQYSTTILSPRRVFLVLHPRHKLQYFARANWETEWIAEAKRIIGDVWVKNYKADATGVLVSVPSSSNSTTDVSDTLTKCLHVLIVYIFLGTVF